MPASLLATASWAGLQGGKYILVQGARLSPAVIALKNARLGSKRPLDRSLRHFPPILTHARGARRLANQRELKNMQGLVCKCLAWKLFKK